MLSAVFGFWGILTAINSATIPYFRQIFSLSWRDAMWVNVAFYLAPFVICLPCSGWMARFGYRRALLLALTLAAGGGLIIALSLWQMLFIGCLVGIFILAMGVAAMQVVANPYVNRLGDEKNASGRLSLASAINSSGAALGPVLLAFITANSLTSLTGLYLFLMLIAGGLLMLFWRSAIPDFSDKQQDALASLRTLWHYPHFRYGLSSIFVYVGVEVAIGTTALSYLHDEQLGGFRLSHATSLVALYWGGALAGRFLYGIVAHLCHPPRVFCCCCMGALLLTLAAMILANRVGGYCLLAIGLMNSVMYPIIFSRTLSGLDHYAAHISAFLIIAGIGGGILPFLQGMMIDLLGLHLSFWLPAMGYLFLLISGLRDHRLPKGTMAGIVQ